MRDIINIIFFNTETYSHLIKEVICRCSLQQTKSASFCYASNINELGQVLSDSIANIHIIIYLREEYKVIEAIRANLVKSRYIVKTTALCKNYREGISAINSGDIYALLVPLREMYIIGFFEYVTHNKLI